MRKLMCLFIVICISLISVPVKSYASGDGSNHEIGLEYLTPLDDDRNLNTVSLNILTETLTEKKNLSLSKGITITRPQGEIIFKGKLRDSSAYGIGPIYLLRYKPFHPGKLSVSLDMSGGFILYSKKFPAEGRIYNFMWRIGPQLIYKAGKNASVNIGYKLMHVSNGSSMFGKGHNPSYDAHGFSLSVLTHF